MNKRPWFPFYVSDWLSSSAVACMSLEEQGAYIRLLCYDWSMDGLPNDDNKLAALSGMGEGWLKGGSRVVGACFKSHPSKKGFITNPRLHSEREKVDEWARKSAAGGRKSAEMRKLSAGKGGSRVVQPPYQPNGNQRATTHTHTHTHSDISPNGDICAPPEGDAAPPAGGGVKAPKKEKRFIIPTREEFVAYGLEIGLQEKRSDVAFDYYQSKGWVVGRAPMKDWKSALRNWKRNENNWRNSGGTGNPRNNGTYDTGTDHAKLVAEQQRRLEAAMAGEVDASENLAF